MKTSILKEIGLLQDFNCISFGSEIHCLLCFQQPHNASLGGGWAGVGKLNHSVNGLLQTQADGGDY